MNPAFWRKWHRWIAFPTALFLLFAAITGVLTAMFEFFGEAEALREATRGMVSSIRTDSPLLAAADRTRDVAQAEAAGAPLAFPTITGFIIYLTMRRKNRSGLQRVFW
jgi:uncharacterized iron-regulated membrane protein